MAVSTTTLKGAILKLYKGAPHGLCPTYKGHVNEDLLAFLKSSTASSAVPVNLS